MDEVKVQKFPIEVDGVVKEAEVLKVFAIDDRKYVVYAVEKNEEESDILASEVIRDENGYEKLIDIVDENIKENVLELVNIMFS